MLCRYLRVGGTRIRLDQGTFDFQIKNLQTGHIDRSTRAEQWPHGGEPGTKHLSRIDEMANGNRNGMDGQHGGPILDSESREVLEGIRGEQSQENGPDNRRSRNSIEILSDRKKPR